MSVTSSIADLLRSAAGIETHRFTSAIIVAAGASRRMEGAGSKQMMELEGMPVIARTLRTFNDSPHIDEIIVVAREDELDIYPRLCELYGFTKIAAVVKGGETRAESVMRGFRKISDKAKYVAIHDGARCLLTEEMLTAVWQKAHRHGAAIAATRAIDTIKLADDKGFVAETQDRNLIWQAQTPQIFAVNVYTAALYTAKENGTLDSATDDSSLVEAIRHPVKLVECGRDNLKITTPDDLVRVSGILAARRAAAAERAPKGGTKQEDAT
ncbi:MAG: 2-C-methyl-D-erythritol 4-phosphate cytidylyltransferase [Ruminococcaceae bacterium]|nr:2-C-methyl-D-erythritol 4-phosphate cytidylyltransferase [Oscillospiraceae bacterium]